MTGSRDQRPAYTIGTLVNDEVHYAAMRASFEAHGFDVDDCEFLCERNPSSAYSALNAILNRARGKRVILCHQDVRLIGEGRDALDARLAELDASETNWAVAGNAGGVSPGALAIRITDPHGADRRVGNLPARVMSLDENFLVVRPEARIGFSRDLRGFHFYGADICLMADVTGQTAHVIDFHLQHLSAGRKDASFARAEADFREKWGQALRPRWMQTTCALLRLDGAIATAWLGTLARPYGHLLRRRSGDDTWAVPRKAGKPRR